MNLKKTQGRWACQISEQSQQGWLLTWDLSVFWFIGFDYFWSSFSLRLHLALILSTCVFTRLQCWPWLDCSWFFHTVLPWKNALSTPCERAAPQLFAFSLHKSAPWCIRTLQETRLSSVLKSLMLTNYTAKNYYTLQQTSQRRVIGKLSSRERHLIYDRLSATLH